MLVLSRGVNERVRVKVGDVVVWVTLVRTGGKVLLGFEGPPEAVFHREEVAAAADAQAAVKRVGTTF